MQASEYSSLRILLLGGKSHALQTLKTALTFAGVTRIAQVEESLRAIELLSLEHYDVVFFVEGVATVENMPFAIAARRISSILNPMMPIFLLQGAVRRSDVEMARDAGATDVLTCPLSPKTVMTKLKAALASPRPFIAAPDFFGPDRRAKARPAYRGNERRTRAPRKAKLATSGVDKPTLL